MDGRAEVGPLEEKKITCKNVQVVLRSSSPLLKILVIVLVVFSVSALIALTCVTAGIRSETEQARQQAAILEEENRDLEAKIADLGSSNSVRQIAREELGLVDPGTILVKPE